MPTVLELNNAGHTNLVNAIGKHGGFRVVAERLGLQRKQDNKPAGYWEDFANIEKALQAFVAERGKDGIMPTTRELEVAGRADLIVAIGKHGGLAKVAERLGLERPKADRPSGYWEDFANVEKELRFFIAEHGTEGIMPTLREMNAAGYSSLAYAINKHGGFFAVAERLGLERVDSDKPLGYWNDFANVERELKDFITNHLKGGLMPSVLELKAAGRDDLINAIIKHGGFPTVSELLGLEPILKVDSVVE